MTDHDQHESRDDAPPFGRSWAGAYLLVLANLLFWIAAFWAFTRAFQ
jgi:hypothetical protein